MKELSINIKVIKSQKDQIIGWKGEVLEIEISKNDTAYIKSFLKENLHVKYIALKKNSNKSYIAQIKAKYIEDLLVLLT